MSVLTADLLVNKGCGTPGCDHDHSVLFMDPQCHPGHPMFAMYEKASERLILLCCHCRKEVGTFQIAAARRQLFQIIAPEAQS